MKASDLVVKALESEGIEMIFALPGEENIDLMESLRTSSIEVVLVRHEQSAGFMAAALGRMTGKPAVCMTTLGPGATNIMTSVAYAHLGGMPCLIITGQKPVRERQQGNFQILDIVEMMTPITKHSEQIIDASHIPATFRQAFRTSVNEKPGPVHLELPEDIAQQQVSDELSHYFPPHTAPLPIARDKDIKLIADKISQSKKPLVLISSGAARSGAAPAIQKLIESQNIYFCTTQMGKGLVDERHPLCLGTAAISSGDYLHDCIEDADLVLNIGHDLSEKPPYIMTSNNGEVVHIDPNPASFDAVYFPQYELIGCIQSSISRVLENLPKTAARASYFKRGYQTIQDKIYNKTLTIADAITPQALVYELDRSLEKDTILSLDNGLYKIWFARHFRASTPQNVLLDNALATMGAGLPVAMAAKMVYPDRPVIAVCGDGGFMMNSQELETACRLRLDLVVMVLTDNAYGMIKWKQENDNFTNFGLDFSAIDLVEYAKTFGAEGHSASAVEQVPEILRSAHDAGGVHLIDVPIVYSAEPDERIG